jgi:hypothetical protein
VATQTADPVEEYEQDHALYCEDALQILTKTSGLQPLILNRCQRIVEDKLDAQLAATGRVRALILKARQPGISTGIAARFFRKTTLWKSRQAKVVADSDDRGDEIFAIYERFQDHLPEELKPATVSTRKGRLLLFNRRRGRGLDSKISVKTARDKKVGRSATIRYLHLSEFAFWDYQEETLLSLMQAVPKGPVGTEVVIESTANGVGDAFHSRWLEAKAGESDWIAIFLPWFVHGEYELPLTAAARKALASSLDEWERKAHVEGIEYEGERWKLSLEQLAWRRDTIKNECGGDIRKFRQEYPSTDREAFLASGNCFFDEEALAEYEESGTRDPIARGNLVVLDAGGIMLSPAERGELQIWEMPQPTRPCPDCQGKRKACARCGGGGIVKTRYVLFADTAEGKEVAARKASFDDPEKGGRDYCSADVFECEGRQYVAHLHGHFAATEFAHRLWRLGYFFPTAKRASLLGVERNHWTGEATIEKLRDLKYPNLYRHRTINMVTQKATEVIGWVTSGETRGPMLEALAAAIRERSVDYPNASGIREMWTFVSNEEGKPEAQEGCHDDRVISAAGALRMARYAVSAPAGSPPEPEVSDTPTGWS